MLARVANPQPEAGGLQTRLNVEDAWKMRGRCVEDAWEMHGRHVECTGIMQYKLPHCPHANFHVDSPVAAGLQPDAFCGRVCDPGK